MFPLANGIVENLNGRCLDREDAQLYSLWSHSARVGSPQGRCGFVSWRSHALVELPRLHEFLVDERGQEGTKPTQYYSAW